MIDTSFADLDAAANYVTVRLEEMFPRELPLWYRLLIAWRDMTSMWDYLPQ